MSFAVSLRSRGAVATAARTATVLSRFGPTASLMARRLERYDEITAEFGIRPTWPTTACVLARHPDALAPFSGRGVELAVHGLVHGDHALLDRTRQRDTIARALELFDREGLRPTGFRGPYLRYNDATLEALRELGFRYHSSQAVIFPLRDGEPRPERAAAFAMALKLYSARDARRVAVTPRLLDGIVDIPVALPDDEILLDRLRFDIDERTAELLHVLELTYERGELFTMQVHPERIPELAGPIGAVLADARARRPAVYIARLDEIADWWLRRARFQLAVARTGDGRYRVRFVGDGDATLLVRGLDVARTAWYGNEARTEVREFDVVGGRMPAVGITRRSPEAIRHFLTEEGIPHEISDDPRAYGAHLDIADADWTEMGVLAAIDAAPGPLVRLGRWPNGARSALAVTGDVDALTLGDFAIRSWETRDWRVARGGVRP
jgi:peptidoglycan/xylan/chitin deacetylase (PgdA/CDA1 family)